MKGFLPVFLSCLLISPTFGESFLRAQSFPTTFADVSFTDRINILRDGYEPYAAEYDKNGTCIKNCAYPGLNIDYEHELAKQDTQNAVTESIKYEQAVKEEKQQTSGNISVDTQRIVSAVNVTPDYSGGHCINRNLSVPSGQQVPWNEPLIGQPYITSPFGPRKLNGKQGYHDGIDYRAKIGTPVYVPADGKVVAVINNSGCGKGLEIKHPDGTSSVYCHLDKQMVKTGEKVYAGCQIAETGNTGHSTGPHLHYGLKDKSGKKIDPAEYTHRGGN